MKQTIIMDTAPWHFKQHASKSYGLLMNTLLFKRLAVCHFGDSNGMFQMTSEIRDAINNGKLIMTCPGQSVRKS